MVPCSAPHGKSKTVKSLGGGVADVDAGLGTQVDPGLAVLFITEGSGRSEGANALACRGDETVVLVHVLDALRKDRGQFVGVPLEGNGGQGPDGDVGVAGLEFPAGGDTVPPELAPDGGENRFASTDSASLSCRVRCGRRAEVSRGCNSQPHGGAKRSTCPSNIPNGAVAIRGLMPPRSARR